MNRAGLLARSRARVGWLVVVACAMGPGCSWIVVDRPPPRSLWNETTQANCTESRAAPLIAAALALAYLGTGIAFASLIDYHDSLELACGLPLAVSSGATGVVVGVSERSGYKSTVLCREFHQMVRERLKTRRAPDPTLTLPRPAHNGSEPVDQ